MRKIFSELMGKTSYTSVFPQKKFPLRK